MHDGMSSVWERGRGGLNENKELIYRAKMGDVAAFEELISGYEKKVYNTVYRFLENTEDARDITQEIFLKIYTSLKNFKEGSSFSTWLYRIAVNTCIDFCRKKKEDALPITDEMDGSGMGQGEHSKMPEDVMENKELKKALNDAIKSLPEDLRMCVVLRDIQGFSYVEISEILKCPTGTIKSRINRGRRVLRQILKDRELFFNKYV